MLASIVTRPSCPRRVGEARVVDAQGGEPSEGGQPGRARADDERADREEQAACGEFSRQQRQGRDAAVKHLFVRDGATSPTRGGGDEQEGHGDMRCFEARR
jgi:hypothetical protein